VPALDHDGRIITESTVICEYLEDEFPTEPPLRPVDSYGRAQMRVWTKWVDEYFCWCVSTIGWERMVKGMARKLSDEEFEKAVERIPLHEQRVKWRRAREGFAQEILDEEMRKIAFSIKKLEARLAVSPWLAGEQYTLADICNFRHRERHGARLRRSGERQGLAAHHGLDPQDQRAAGLQADVRPPAERVGRTPQAG